MDYKRICSDTRIKWSLVDQFFVSGGNFLSIAICAHYLPINDQGKLGYILAWYLGTIIINNSTVFQHASVKAPSIKNQYAYLCKLAWLQMGLALSSSILITLTVTGLNFIDSLFLSQQEIGLLLFFLLTQQLADFSRRISYIFNGSVQAVKLSSVLYSARVIALLFIEPTNLSYVLVIFIATSALSVITNIRLLYKGRHFLYEVKNFVKLHVAESIWFIRNGPFIWLWSSLPVFLLGVMIDAAAMAVFFTIRSLSNLGNVAMELLETEFSARIGRLLHSDQGQAEKSVQILRLVGFVIWGIGMAIFMFFGKDLIQIIFGDSYTNSADLLVMLWFSNGVVFLYRLNAVYLRSTGNSDAVMKGYMFGVGVMLIAGIPLISMYEVFGGAMLVTTGAATILVAQKTIANLKAK